MLVLALAVLLPASTYPFLLSPSKCIRRRTPVLASTPTPLPPGVSKTILNPGSGPPISVGDIATVKYTCTVPGNPHPFAASSSQKVVVGDGLMIDGWELCLPTMKRGEEAEIRITDPEYGYGGAGVPPFVPPDSPIEIRLEVLDAEAGVDLGTIASADPLKPRTPASIAAAYATRRELAALEEADRKPGIEGLIEKFKTFYFFGFFEGETGERPPWYLRPSITFPMAFAVVGAAFWVLVSFGGITERGAQVMDDLDEMILQETLWMFFM